MSVKDLFSNSKKYISRKRMSQNYRRDRVFQGIMRDPGMAESLDRPAEQKKFHDRLMEAAKDGKVDSTDMKKIAYEAAHGKIEDISSAEGRTIAKTIFPDSSRRYISAKSESNGNTKKSANISEKIRSKKVSPAFFAYRTRSRKVSSDTGKDKENPYANFYNSMQSVSRNKH